MLTPMNRQGFFFFHAVFSEAFWAPWPPAGCCLAWGFSKVISCGYFCFALAWHALALDRGFFSTACVAIYAPATAGESFRQPSRTRLPSSNVAAAVSLLNFPGESAAVSSPFLVAFFPGQSQPALLSGALAVFFWRWPGAFRAENGTC